MTSSSPAVPNGPYKPRKPPRKTSSRGTGTGPRVAGPPPDYFTSPDDIRLGAALYDRDHDMPGRARNVLNGRFVELERPTGYTWRVHFRRVRPATEREVRQLDALARLHRARLRGLAGA